MTRAWNCRSLMALALCASCTLSNLTPQARFSDATFLVNDSSRWGQLDVAISQVAPSYQTRFLARREGWGERISIAEADIVHMHIDREKDEAYSVVNVVWTSDNITVRKSVISQVWSSRRGQFRLKDETLKSGDPALFQGH
jgi:hypothetical protein